MKLTRRLPALIALLAVTGFSGCTKQKPPTEPKKQEAEDVSGSYLDPVVNTLVAPSECRLMTSEVAMDSEGTIYAAHQDRNPVISRIDPVGYLSHNWAEAEGPVRQIFVSTAGVVVVRIELVRGSKLVKFDRGGQSTDLFFWPSAGTAALAPDGTVALFAAVGGPVDGGKKTLTFIDLDGKQVRQVPISFCTGAHQLLFDDQGTALLFSSNGSNSASQHVISRVAVNATENGPWVPVPGARYHMARNGEMIGWNIHNDRSTVVNLTRLSGADIEEIQFVSTMSITGILADNRDHLVDFTREGTNGRMAAANRISRNGRASVQIWIASPDSTVSGVLGVANDTELVLLGNEEVHRERIYALHRFKYRDE